MVANSQPNYITIINWFWHEVPFTNGYRPLYGLLFLAIVDGLNRNGWRPNTTMDYERIVNKGKFTKAVYLDGRKWLAENNFIAFVPGKNNMQMASFSLGAAVGILTGVLTGVLTHEEEEILPASLPVNLPIIKHKTSKQKNKKPKTLLAPDLNIPFEVVWKLYNKEKDKLVSEKLWNGLSDEKRSKAFEHIPKYVESTPEVNYRKDFKNYIKAEIFNEPIIAPNEKANTSYSQKSSSGKQAGSSLAFDRLSKTAS